MRYLISSVVDGLSTFDRCPFCEEMFDGHPYDIVQHMNSEHPKKGKWKLVTVSQNKDGVDGGMCRVNLAVPVDEKAV